MADNVTLHRATPEEVESVGKLSDVVFRPTLVPGTGMAKEFNLTFSASNASNLYFARVDGEPVSLVAIQPGYLATGDATLRSISMGSVCTLAEQRKLHIASQLIQEVLKDWQDEASVLLVSGGLSIYRRIECVDFGQRREALLSRQALSDVPMQSRVTPFDRNTHGVEHLARLYNAEFVHFGRSSEDFSEMLDSFHAPLFRLKPVPPRVFVATSGEDVTAYAVAAWNRPVAGEPTKVTIMEWSGSRSHMVELCSFIAKWYGADTVQFIINGAHPDDTTLVNSLQQLGATISDVPNEGTVRVIHAKRIASELQPYLEARFGATLELQEVTSESWKVHWHPVNGEVSGDKTKTSAAPDNDKILQGYGQLSEWLFGREGLGIPLPNADDLNFV